MKNQIKHIGEVLNACAKEILDYTPQLYEIAGSADNYDSSQVVDVEPIASSILLKIDENCFLITAGHVFDRKIKNNIGVMISNEIHYIMGDLKYTDIHSDELSGKIDIAVLKLNQDLVESLQIKYKFLNLDRIAYDHIVVSTHKYLIVGYPTKTTKKEKGKKAIIPKPLIFGTSEADQRDYKKNDPLINVLLKYRQKKVRNLSNNQIEMHASPIGISGCGVWYIPNFTNPQGGLPDYQLMGFINEQNAEKTFLIATRIHILTEVLRKIFEVNIPKSNIISLNNKQTLVPSNT